MSTELKSFLEPEGHCYEPLIEHSEGDDKSDDDSEAVSTENAFSLLIYFCFFVIGLSMMWTWYVNFNFIYLSEMKLGLIFKIGQ
jgi:hypothetical protein